jgi:hypothetical protein
MKKYKVKIFELQIFEEEFKTPNAMYKFSCKGFLVRAEKSK